MPSIKPIRDIANTTTTPSGDEWILIDNGIDMSKAKIDDAVAPKATEIVEGKIADLNLGTAATANVEDFATAAQGSKADTAVQPSDLATVATTGDYTDLTNKPALGTVASHDVEEFATAEQGEKADTAVQPEDLAAVATTGSYNDLLDKPTLGTAAAADASDFATATQGAKADTAVQAVNGKTGTSITLTAADVGAAASSHTHPDATTSSAGFMSATDKQKLDGIEVGAQVNAVTSVAGKIGAVTLTASDVGAAPDTIATALAGGTNGQVLIKASDADHDFTWMNIPGGGDMLTPVYDPNGVAADAFNMDNMREGSTNLILTAAERADIAANASARHTHSNKSILDATEQAFTTALKNKLDGIEVGAQVNSVISVAGKTGAVTLSASDISGLGNAATRNVGTTSGTVAAGDDSRITGALQRSGDTMTGALTLSGDPTSNLHAATKQYVDDNFVSASQAQTLTPAQQAQARENIGLEYAPRDILNPYAFGAAGDGVTDDGPALRAMFAQAGFIYIPKGVYRVMDGYIRLYSDTTVVMHPEAIIINDIQDTAWQKACLFVNGPQGGTADNGGYDNTRNIHFQGGTIDGSGRADRGLMSALFNIAHHDNISFRDMKIINPSGNTHAIELNSTRHGLVENVIFDGYKDNGATLGTREYINIDASTEGGFPEFGPWDGTICDDIIIRRCRFLNGDVGVGSHSAPAQYHTNILVEDCYVDGMVSCSIDVRYWDKETSECRRITSVNIPFDYRIGSPPTSGAFLIDGRFHVEAREGSPIWLPTKRFFSSMTTNRQGLVLVSGNSSAASSPRGLYWGHFAPTHALVKIATASGDDQVTITTGPLSGSEGAAGGVVLSADTDKFWILSRRSGNFRLDVRFMGG